MINILLFDRLSSACRIFCFLIPLSVLSFFGQCSVAQALVCSDAEIGAIKGLQQNYLAWARQYGIPACMQALTTDLARTISEASLISLNPNRSDTDCPSCRRRVQTCLIQTEEADPARRVLLLATD